MNQPDPNQYPQPDQQQYQQQPHPQQMPPGQYPPGQYPQPYPQRQGGGSKVAIIIVCVVVGLLFLGGLLVGILSVAVMPKLTEAKTKLEVKQLNDLQAGLQNIAADASKKRKLHSKTLKDTRGERFWTNALEQEVIDDGLAPRMTSLLSHTDTALQNYRGGTPVPAGSFVSYTAPRSDQLLSAMSRKGDNRCVLITWNSRNWNNQGGDRVPVVWSDEHSAKWMTFGEANVDWNITREEWDDPANKLFGKKAPFEYTYD